MSRTGFSIGGACPCFPEGNFGRILSFLLWFLGMLSTLGAENHPSPQGVIPTSSLSSSPKEISVRFLPLLGTYYRPGAWCVVRVIVSLSTAISEEVIPELLVYPEESEEPEFSSRLAGQKLQAGEACFDFWMIAGIFPPRLTFQLVSSTGHLYLRRDALSGTLLPLAPTERLLLTTGIRGGLGPERWVAIRSEDLPRHVAAYESVDLLILGSLTGERLIPPLDSGQLHALASWVASGGIMLGFDPVTMEGVRCVARSRGWNLSVARPLLPSREKNTPQLEYLGRGKILSFPLGGAGALEGQAAWRRIRQYLLPSPAVDLRLAPHRYARWSPSWLPPPRTPPSAFRTWLFAWLAAVFAFLILPPLRRSLGRAAIVTFIVSVFFGVLFLSREEPRPFSAMHLRFRLADETGIGGPSLEESLWILSPFASQHRSESAGEGKNTLIRISSSCSRGEKGKGPEMNRISLLFPRSESPLPKLLAADGVELRSTRLELEEMRNGALRLSVFGRGGDSPIQRGAPLFFSSRQAGPPLSFPLPLCRVSSKGISLQGRGKSKEMYDTVLHVTKGWLSLGTYAGETIPPRSPMQMEKKETDRERVSSWLASEHRPGAYATILGWTDPSPHRISPSETDLGELWLFALPLVPE